MIPANVLEIVRELYALGATEIRIGDLHVCFPPRMPEAPQREVVPGRQLTDQEAYVLSATASS